MRIIGGQLGGRQVMPPRHLPVRPTTDMAREGLFNIIANAFDFSQIRVLELFSGTGIISLEFASRGCPDITAVDNHPDCVSFLKTAARDFKLDTFRVARADVFQMLKKPLPVYDIIFADPPYDHPGVKELPDMIFRYPSISEHGWFILEHSSRHSFIDHPHFHQHRRYGDVNFTIMVPLGTNQYPPGSLPV